MTDPLPILRRALDRLDARGRFAATDVAALREVVPDLGARANALDHPADLFGPWWDLPEASRAAFRNVVGSDLRQSAALYPRWGPWTGSVRALRQADAFLTERWPAGRLRRLCVRGATRLHDGPFHAWRRARTTHARRRWARADRPGLGDLLAVLDRDPRWLIGDFVRGVPLPPSAPGYWDDPRRNVVHGYQIGLDLLPTASGMLCIEANLRSGIKMNRFALGFGEDLTNEAVALAQAMNARRLIWVELQILPLIDRALEGLHRAASEAGLTLEILEDPTMKPQGPRSPLAREIGSYRDMKDLPPHTLVLSRRDRPWGADYLINHKGSSTRVMEAFLHRTGDRRFHVIPMTRRPDLPEESDPGLPNLVYKYPDSSSGKGVFFMRARDEGHAVEMARRLDRERGEPPGLFQRFAQGPLADGRRVFDVRTEIFITPREVRYGVSMRRVSGRAVPERLEYGIVDDNTLFASNIGRGGRLERTGDETPVVREAAMAVGEAFRTALNRTFVTRSNGGA